MTLQKPFRVVPADQEIVERVADRSLTPAMAAATSVRTIMVGRTPRGTSILCDVAIHNPPMGAAFEIFVRVGEREWSVGMLAAEQGERERRHTALRRTGGAVANPFISDFPADAMIVDVVLRPSVEAAERAGVLKIWDGEIVFKDVPMARSNIE